MPGALLYLTRWNRRIRFLARPVLWIGPCNFPPSRRLQRINTCSHENTMYRYVQVLWGDYQEHTVHELEVHWTKVINPGAGHNGNNRLTFRINFESGFTMRPPCVNAAFTPRSLWFFRKWATLNAFRGRRTVHVSWNHSSALYQGRHSRGLGAVAPPPRKKKKEKRKKEKKKKRKKRKKEEKKERKKEGNY